jgi:hypothetical protein
MSDRIVASVHRSCGRHVGDVHHTLALDESIDAAPGSGAEWLTQQYREGFRHPLHGDGAKPTAVADRQRAMGNAAQRVCLFQDRIEHRDKVAWRRIDDLQYLGDGGDFTELDETSAEAAATTLLGREGPEMTALGRAVLQCYYRDDRVFRALGIELRAPYPKGRVLEQGDWSLLDAVRGRPRLWRDIDGMGR